MCSANKHPRIATHIVIFAKQIHTPNARAHNYNLVQKWEYVLTAAVSHPRETVNISLTRENYKKENLQIQSLNDWCFNYNNIAFGRND